MSQGPETLVTYPPVKPLEFPLSPKQVCDIFGMAKSTLFRWEAEGCIPAVPRDYTNRLIGKLPDRVYGPAEIAVSGLL